MKMNMKWNISLTPDTISNVDKLLFTKHLAVMLKSGITLGEALGLIKEQATRANMKRLATAIQRDVDNGKPFHDALAIHPKAFDPMYLRLIAIGEESGTLQRNLEYMAVQLRKKYDFEKKVKGAMMYPTVILAAAGIAGVGLSVFVLPKLIDLFDTLDIALPLSTRILLGLAYAMKSYGIILLIGLVIGLFGINFALHTKQIRPLWHSFLLRLPVLGTFLRNVELAQFCRNMGIMLQSGLPINNALAAQAEATNNLVYKRYVQQFYEYVEKGKSLEETLALHKFPFITPIMAKMIGVGEKTGKLDESLLYLGDFFEDEVDDAARNFSTIIEPLVLLLVGVIVAFVAFAIISPIYQFSGGIKR
jgi:type II secretory pathway component PulF